MDVDELFQASPRDRQILIAGATGLSLGNNSSLETATAISDVLKPILGEYFERAIRADNQRVEGSVLTDDNFRNAALAEIEAFRPTAEEAILSAIRTPNDVRNDAKNIYSMFGAAKLASANNVTRSLSTTMGALWERIANISPYGINPETEFLLKIVGVDVIARNKSSSVIEYIQLKTQRNTLTGSQKNRSVAELSIHDNPRFCAAFLNSSTWTFRCDHIPRVAGKEFWSRLGIKYEIVLELVEPLMMELEDSYIAALA